MAGGRPASGHQSEVLVLLPRVAADDVPAVVAAEDDVPTAAGDVPAARDVSAAVAAADDVRNVAAGDVLAAGDDPSCCCYCR